MSLCRIKDAFQAGTQILPTGPFFPLKCGLDDIDVGCHKILFCAMG